MCCAPLGSLLFSGLFVFSDFGGLQYAWWGLTVRFWYFGVTVVMLRFLFAGNLCC